MKKLYFETQVSGNYQSIFERFDVKLFKALKPPGVNLEVVRFDGSKKGNEVHLKIGQLGITLDWVSIITEDYAGERECYFIDEGRKLPPPLKYWRHQHIVRRVDNSTSLIIDDISFACHGGILVESAMWPVLYAQFAARGPIYRGFFS